MEWLWELTYCIASFFGLGTLLYACIARPEGWLVTALCGVALSVVSNKHLSER